MSISKRRKSEGDIARICYQQYLMFKESKDVSDTRKAKELRSIAQSLKQKIERDDTHRTFPDDDESSYDRLVCQYFR